MTQFLHRLLLICASVFLAVLTWLAAETIKSERAITAATLQTEHDITASITRVPALADAHLVALERKIDALTEIASLTSDSLQRTSIFAIHKLDDRLASIQGDAKTSLNRANRSIALVANAAAVSIPAIAKSADKALISVTKDVHAGAGDVHAIAVPAASVAAQVADAAPMYLDCDPATGGGQDCLFNRYVGVSVATEKTMQAIAKATPQIVESTARIESDLAKEADAITKPKRWYQKLFGGITLAAEIAARSL